MSLSEAILLLIIGYCLTIAFWMLLELITQSNKSNKERYLKLKKLKSPVIKNKFKIQRRRKNKQKKRAVYSLICNNPLCNQAIYFYYDYCKGCLLKEGILLDE